MTIPALNNTFKKSSLLFRLLILALPLSSFAQRPMRGPLPEEQRRLIHEMARAHEKITREVELTASGYRARTTSADPEIVAMLKAHVAYMKERLASGAMVRRWDPAFVELVAHHEDISAEIIDLDNGVEVQVTGATPAAVRVAQNHARIVNGFVNEGEAAVRRKHSRALVDSPNE